MSGGIHRLWKDVFLRKMALSHDTKVLDVAGGTGDITFRILKYMETYYGKDHTGFVQVVDINPDMLEVGKKRAVEMGLYDGTLFKKSTLRLSSILLTNPFKNPFRNENQFPSR